MTFLQRPILIFYELWPQLAEFDVVWNVNTSKLCLCVKEKLDRELEPTYKLNLIARDGGIESNTGSITVIVNVLDENDNDPRFERSVYDVTIPEDTLVSSRIIKVIV